MQHLNKRGISAEYLQNNFKLNESTTRLCTRKVHLFILCRELGSDYQFFSWSIIAPTLIFLCKMKVMMCNDFTLRCWIRKRDAKREKNQPLNAVKTNTCSFQPPLYHTKYESTVNQLMLYFHTIFTIDWIGIENWFVTRHLATRSLVTNTLQKSDTARF